MLSILCKIVSQIIAILMKIFENIIVKPQIGIKGENILLIKIQINIDN